MKARQLLMGMAILILIMSVASLIALAQLQGPLTSPLISNGVACIQFNNPPPYPGNTYPVHWDVFSVALNGGNPCNYPNLFIGDLRASETVHLFYYNGYTGAGDGAPQIGPYTKLYIVNGRTILGVINASNGLREVTYYELVGNLPVVYVNFTVSNLPQSTMVWYGINFINDIYVDANPGETTWVVALGVGNYSFPAQDPNEMYNLAINWGFKATLTPDQFTPGSFAIIYIPPSAGQFAWMEINQPGVGTYYLALYPLTPIDGYYVVSANGWGFDKVIGLVFSNDTTSANGALLVVYGSSLSNLEQNINEALSILGVSTKPSTHTSTQPALGLSLIVTIIVIVLVIIIGIVLIMSIRGRRSKGGGETRGPIESAPPPPPSLPQQSMEGTRIYSSETLVKSAQEETRVKEKEQ